MPETQELREKVQQHHTILFGAEGQGGIMRDIQEIQNRQDEHEKRLNAVSAKWLIIMLLAGMAGNGIGGALLKTLHLLP